MELTRDERISAEVLRLRTELPDTPAAAIGLIEEAAFLRVEMADLKSDINKYGSTEVFKNTPDGTPITRVRASAAQHEKLVRVYAGLMRQLTAMIPEPEEDEEGAAKQPELDPFIALLQRKYKAQ